MKAMLYFLGIVAFVLKVNLLLCGLVFKKANIGADLIITLANYLGPLPVIAMLVILPVTAVVVFIRSILKH